MLSSWSVWYPSSHTTEPEHGRFMSRECGGIMVSKLVEKKNLGLGGGGKIYDRMKRNMKSTKQCLYKLGKNLPLLQKRLTNGKQ